MSELHSDAAKFAQADNVDLLALCYFPVTHRRVGRDPGTKLQLFPVANVRNLLSDGFAETGLFDPAASIELEIILDCGLVKVKMGDSAFPMG